tara:strand:- start:1955 stop:2086 length:132 start_codon:yes stop_codon:yes gene_type:complete
MQQSSFAVVLAARLMGTLSFFRMLRDLPQAQKGLSRKGTGLKG